MSDPAMTDHAELARLARAAYNDYALSHISVGGGMRATVSVPAFIAAANPARVLALLAEIAALRGERDGYCPDGAELPTWPEVAGYWKDRATQAERHVDEAREVIRELIEPYERFDDVKLFQVLPHGLAARITSARTFPASMEPKT